VLDQHQHVADVAVLVETSS